MNLIKLTFIIFLFAPVLSHAFNFTYSCKSNQITGTYDYYVINLGSRTIEKRSLYNNKVTRKGLVATNISFREVPVSQHEFRRKHIEIKNSQGEAFFWIEKTNSHGLVASRRLSPGQPYVDAFMACTEGSGIPPVSHRD
jgi:hypothetical protein